MRGAGDDVCVGEWGGVSAACNQAGNMAHIHHQVSANLVGNLAECGPVPFARIGGAARDNQLWLVLFRNRHDLVHVDALVFLAHPVSDGIEPFAAHIDGRPMGQVAARIQVEAHKGVARLQQRKKNCLVHLRAAVGLDVCKFAAEQFLRPVDRQRFHDIRIVAAAVIALAGISLCVFVGEHATGSFQHGLAGNVFTRDQFDLVLLALQFVGDGARDLRIGRGKIVVPETVHDVGAGGFGSAHGSDLWIGKLVNAALVTAAGKFCFKEGADAGLGHVAACQTGADRYAIRVVMFTGEGGAQRFGDQRAANSGVAVDRYRNTNSAAA